MSEEKLLVLDKLPEVETRKLVSEDGKTTYNIVTANEALTEILEKTREMHKSITS